MGLLTCGTPLSWPDTKLHADLVKRQGIQEFLRIYAKYKSLRGQPFKWGDEIEFSIIRFDHSRKRAQLLLKSDTVMDELNAFFPVERTNIVFHPEYSNYMIETCPHMPFDASLNCFRNLEEHFRFRRQLVESRLEPGEHIISLTCFPLLGCPNFAYPSYSPTPTCGVTRSLFLPDEAIFSGHPRFPTITSNTLEVTLNALYFTDYNSCCNKARKA
jgi:glutamate--cysteine ligase catalytic subunit